MKAEDSDNNDVPNGPPPDPSLRQWRHPSEIASANAAAKRDAQEGQPSRWRSPSFVGGTALVLVGTLLLGAGVIGPLANAEPTSGDPELLATATPEWTTTSILTFDNSAQDSGSLDSDNNLLSQQPGTTATSTPADPESDTDNRDASPTTGALTTPTVPPAVATGANGVVAILDADDNSLIATGLVIDGMVLSSAYPFDGYSQVLVSTPDGPIDGLVDGADPFNDLVVISVLEPERLPAPAAAATTDSDVDTGTDAETPADQAQMGNSVWIITADGEQSVAIRSGELSSIDEDIISSGGELLFDTFQTTVRTPYLDAGSALVDESGATIGMVISCERQLAYAVPLSSLRIAANSIRETGWGHIGWLGIEGESSSLGVEVTGVESLGPAGVAGLQAGDRITDLNGEPLRHLAEIVRAVREAGVGNDIEFVVARGDETVSLTITVGTRVS